MQLDENKDTIVALSSGGLPSGVAIIRLSGDKSLYILNKFCNFDPKSHELAFKNIYFDGKLLDKGLVVYFKAPNSFTGEDVVEFQIHGSVAIVRAMIDAICSFEGVRLAQSGEFIRRAFINGKLDLLEVEGISDLLEAETESQRILAVARMDGELSKKIDDWRNILLSLRGEIEANLDFNDEGDVGDILPDYFYENLEDLENSLKNTLIGFNQGRIIRDGFRIAIAGLPNAGKSSLINMLSKSDLAIVSEEEGTTRDIREVEMNIAEQLVIFIDMAGLRNSTSDAENQGIKRAETEIKNADLVLWLSSPDAPKNNEFQRQKIITSAPIFHIGTKSDIGENPLNVDLEISCLNRSGIELLLEKIKDYINKININNTPILISRTRDKNAINATIDLIKKTRTNIENPEIAADFLRQASNELSRLIGIMEPEQVLGQIFSNFCIGK